MIIAFSIGKMINLNLIDSHFSHSISSCAKEPKLGKWKRDNLNDSDSIFITDSNFNQDTVNACLRHKKKIYGWLLESPRVTNYAYKFALENHTLFEKIFTFDKALLEHSDVFNFLPIGGCWIDDCDISLYTKTKNISIIASQKKHLEGQILRHDVVKKFNNEIDLYGRGYNPIEKKLEGLKDYKYSIIIENTKSDYYFTEKLIDCLATGTIPIYWGCPSISKFFNIDGIIEFDTLEDLETIILKINSGLISINPKVILENFNKCKDYLIADDLIFEKFINNE